MKKKKINFENFLKMANVRLPAHCAMLRRLTMGVIVGNCIAYHMLFCTYKNNHFLPLLKNKALFIYLFDYGTP